MSGKIPHLHIVVVFCLAAIVGYAAFSAYVVVIIKDATMIGDTIGTWKSFAVLAFGFWIGSSSAGKAKDPKDLPADAKNAADHVADAATEEAAHIAGERA